MWKFMKMAGINAETITAKLADDMLIDAETITANQAKDVIIDAETITADRAQDQVIDAETITADQGDDILSFKDLVYGAAKSRGGDDGETINVSEPTDYLFDPNNFGETPPLDLSYELDEVGGFGETPPEDIAYTLDLNL